MIFKIAIKNIFNKPLNFLLGWLLLTVSVGIISLLLLVQQQIEQQFTNELNFYNQGSSDAIAFINRNTGKQMAALETYYADRAALQKDALGKEIEAEEFFYNKLVDEQAKAQKK